MGSARSNFHLIKDAYNSLSRKKVSNSIVILEKVLSSGVGDIYVLFLLAVAYLYSDQFGKAARFITKMKEINPDYLPLVHLEAFLHIKSASTYEEVARHYLNIVQLYPADPHIHRGRRLLLRVEDFPAFQKSARLHDFVNIPRPPKNLKTSSRGNIFVGELDRKGIRIKKGAARTMKAVKASAVILGVGGAIALGWYLFVSGIFSLTAPGTKNRNADLDTVDRVSVGGTDYDIIRNINRNDVSYYYDSVHDMTGDFDHARRLIKEEKYNEAVLLLNRIYNSNINFIVKEKVEFLVKFVSNLEERDYDRVPFERVEARKHLYRGYAIQWDGRVSGIRAKGQSQTFTLTIEAGDAKGSREADIYSTGRVQGLRDGAMVSVKGIISNILGKNERIYIIANEVTVNQ